MHKMRIVVFTSNNARMLTNPENPDQYKNASNCVVNPSLDAVLGIPPHYWKLRDGQILPMSEVERKARDLHHVAVGVDNSTFVTPKRTRKWPYATLAGISLALSIVAYFVVHNV